MKNLQKKQIDAIFAYKSNRYEINKIIAYREYNKCRSFPKKFCKRAHACQNLHNPKVTLFLRTTEKTHFFRCFVFSFLYLYFTKVGVLLDFWNEVNFEGSVFLDFFSELFLFDNTILRCLDSFLII